jgi:MFS family permease
MLKISNRGLFKGLSGNVIILGLVSFLNDTSSEMIYPLLPLFLSSQLGATGLIIGLIEGAAETISSLFKYWSGYFSDKLGARKGLILSGYTISTVARPIIALAKAPWHIFMARSFDRMGKGIRTSPRDALIAASCDETSRGRAFGLHRSFDHAGAVLGPLIAFGILLFSPENYRLVFLLAVIPAFLGVFVILFFVKEASVDKNGNEKGKKLSFKSFPIDYRIFIISVCLFTLGNSSDAFLILRAKQLGIHLELIPILWVYFHIVKTISSTPSGIVSDSLGRKNTILTGWLIYCFVYFGFALATKTYHAWILFGFYGLFYGLTEGVEKAFISDMVPDSARGTGYGFYNLSLSIGALPSSLIMGLIWDKAGPFWAFSFGAAMSVLAALILMAFVVEDVKKDSP